VHGTLLVAAVSPDNTPHGYNLTFAFPMLMFIIIAGALYLRFRRTHRVPGHVELASSRWASTPLGAGPVTPHSAAAAAQPVAAAMEQTDPGATITAHGATDLANTGSEVAGRQSGYRTADAGIGETTAGSTLHEGTSADGAEGPGSASTEDGE
jgi:hypothetical protein